MKGLKHNSHSVGQNCFHLVWKIKYAYSFLNRLHLKKCVEGMIKLLALQKGWEIYELKVMPDHVHLFISFPPTVAPTYVLAVLKAKTSSIARDAGKLISATFHLTTSNKSFLLLSLELFSQLRNTSALAEVVYF